MAADIFTAAHISYTSPQRLTGSCKPSRGRAGPPHTLPMYAWPHAGEQGGELGDWARGALEEEAEQGCPELHQEDVCMSRIRSCLESVSRAVGACNAPDRGCMRHGGTSTV
jgi:hypothetical protein